MSLNKLRSALCRVAVAVVVAGGGGVILVGCGDSDGGGGGGGITAPPQGPPVTGSPTLTLSGQVQYEDYNQNGQYFANYTGNLTVSDDGIGGTGAVTNGMFNYTVGVPLPTSMLPLTKELAEDYLEDYTVTLSKTGVSAAIIEEFSVDGADVFYGSLGRFSESSSETPTSFTGREDYVMYVYVDSDITVTGVGTTYTDTHTDYGFPYTEKWTTSNFVIELKAGWNACHMSGLTTGSLTGSPDNPTSVTMAFTMTMAIGNPQLRWVLNGYYPPSPPDQLSPAPSSDVATDNVWQGLRASKQGKAFGGKK